VVDSPTTSRNPAELRSYSSLKAGLAVVGDSYEADSPFYTVTAAMQWYWAIILAVLAVRRW
jgi:hypothetical protein